MLQLDFRDGYYLASELDPVDNPGLGAYIETVLVSQTKIEKHFQNATLIQEMQDDRLKETIILNTSVPNNQLIFTIKTNAIADLQRDEEGIKYIYGNATDNSRIFRIDPIFVEDVEGKRFLNNFWLDPVYDSINDTWTFVLQLFATGLTPEYQPVYPINIDPTVTQISPDTFDTGLWGEPHYGAFNGVHKMYAIYDGNTAKIRYFLDLTEKTSGAPFGATGSNYRKCGVFPLINGNFRVIIIPHTSANKIKYADYNSNTDSWSAVVEDSFDVSNNYDRHVGMCLALNDDIYILMPYNRIFKKISGGAFSSIAGITQANSASIMDICFDNNGHICLFYGVNATTGALNYLVYTIVTNSFNSEVTVSTQCLSGTSYHGMNSQVDSNGKIHVQFITSATWAQSVIFNNVSGSWILKDTICVHYTNTYSGGLTIDRNNNAILYEGDTDGGVTGIGYPLLAPSYTAHSAHPIWYAGVRARIIPCQIPTGFGHGENIWMIGVKEASPYGLYLCENSDYQLPTGDIIAPTIQNQDPAPDETDVAINSNIYFELRDNIWVNPASINITIEGVNAILAGVFQSGFTGYITANGVGYDVTINPSVDFDSGQVVNIAGSVADFTGNILDFSYSFTCIQEFSAFLRNFSPGFSEGTRAGIQ